MKQHVDVPFLGCALVDNHKELLHAYAYAYTHLVRIRIRIRMQRAKAHEIKKNMKLTNNEIVM